MGFWFWFQLLSRACFQVDALNLISFIISVISWHITINVLFPRGFTISPILYFKLSVCLSDYER